LTRLAAFGEELVAVAGDELLGLDQATAQERWRTSLDGEITDLSTMGETIVAHTGDGFVGVDRTSGELRWQSTDTGLPELAAVVMGRGRMFGVTEATDGAVTVHAVDPHTGEIAWSMEDSGSDTGDGPAAVAFDDSEQGQPTLYVMQGDAVTAFNTTTRRPRWQAAIDGARPSTLTALAGGVLLLTADGRLCRYSADSGEPVWSECASLQREDPDARIVSVHDNHVIVAGAHEVMSVDFTSGRRQWRTSSDRELQPAVTTGPSAAYITAPDGTIVAIGQRDGASLWETAPFGSVTAMTATDEAVFVATGDGRLARLDTAADSDA
jgi:outer membrane protein assembly factor BamB